MADAWFLGLAAACSLCGMAWFALAMPPHWSQVRQAKPPRGAAARLRVAGTMATVVSLALCLGADHLSMASLVWILMSSGAAFAVAFTLAFRPHALRWLVAWVGPSE